jgi:hypothetical protein
MIWVVSSQKKVYKWPTNIWKMLNIINLQGNEIKTMRYHFTCYNDFNLKHKKIANTDLV